MANISGEYLIQWVQDDDYGVISTRASQRSAEADLLSLDTPLCSKIQIVNRAWSACGTC